MRTISAVLLGVLVGALLLLAVAGFRYNPIITGAVLIVLSVLALSFVGCVTVRNATATAFEALGRFVYCAMELTGHHFDPNGFVEKDAIPGIGPNIFGSGSMLIFRIFGWVFYLKPFVRPVPYRDKSDDDGFGEGFAVRLNEIQQELSLVKAETAAPENIALNVSYVAVMRIVNPYLYLYIAPKDAKKQIISRIDAALRGWVRSGTDEHAQTAKGNGQALWAELTATTPTQQNPNPLNCWPVFNRIETDWGVEILEESIIVKDIDYDAEYQAALKAEQQAKLQAKAELMRQRIGAMSFAAQTSGTEISMISNWIGVPVKTLRKELQDAIAADHNNGFETWLKKYPVATKNWNLIQQRVLGVRPVLFGNADGTALDPILASLAALANLIKGGGSAPSVPQSPPGASGSNPIEGFGAGGAGNQRSAKKGGKRKRVVDMTEEEKERFAKEQDGA